MRRRFENKLKYLKRTISTSIEEVCQKKRNEIGKRTIIISKNNEIDSLQLGLKTQYELRMLGIEPIIYNYREKIPTIQSINEAYELASRMGMSSIVSIGSCDVLNIAKGVKFQLQNRKALFSPYYSIQSSLSSSKGNFEIPLISIPTSLLATNNQPSLAFVKNDNSMLWRYPIQSPNEVILIPSLISEYISEHPFFNSLSPPQIFTIYYFSLIAKYFDTIFSSTYLSHKSKSEKNSPLIFDQSQIKKYQDLFYDCLEARNIETNSIISAFETFNQDSALFRNESFKTIQQFHPNTNLSRLSIIETLAIIQQQSSFQPSLPFVILEVKSFYEVLSYLMKEDENDILNKSIELQSLHYASKQIIQLFNYNSSSTFHHLENIIEVINSKIKKEIQYKRFKPTSFTSSQVSFLVEDIIQFEEDEQLSYSQSNKQNSLKESSNESSHISLLKSDTFSELIEKILVNE